MKSSFTKPLNNSFSRRNFAISGALFLFCMVVIFFAMPFSEASARIIPERIVPECNITNIDYFRPGGTGDPIINPCTACHFFQLIQNLMAFLIWGLTVPVAVLFFIYGGFLMVVSSFMGDAGSMRNRGKRVILNVLTGLAIIFFSWTIVNTTINVLGGKMSGDGTAGGGFMPWNELKCEPGVSVAPTPTPPPPTPLPPPTPATCPNCVSLTAMGLPQGSNTCCGGNNCQVHQTVAQQLQFLNQRFLNEGRTNYWRITEAWPPTVNHLNPCHSQGTCIDANFIQASNRGNPSDISYFINQASGVGLHAVYEVSTQERRNQLIASGVSPSNIIVANITGEHFSVYSPPLSNSGVGGGPPVNCSA